MSVRIDYDPDDQHPHKWTVTTDDDGWDASGVDLTEALARLVEVLHADLKRTRAELAATLQTLK